MKKTPIIYTISVLILIAIGYTGVYIHKTSELGAIDLLTEVKAIQIGARYIHIFDDNGKIIEIETTKEEYESLGLKGAGQPTYSDARWVSSAGGIPIMGMPELKDNEYYRINGTSSDDIIIKLPDEEEKTMDLKDL